MEVEIKHVFEFKDGAMKEARSSLVSQQKNQTQQTNQNKTKGGCHLLKKRKTRNCPSLYVSCDVSPRTSVSWDQVLFLFRRCSSSVSLDSPLLKWWFNRFSPPCFKVLCCFLQTPQEVGNACFQSSTACSMILLPFSFRNLQDFYTYL